jgi:hypothetical protein
MTMNRKDSMIEMRFIKKMSLQSIGDYYGISRERVRQIIGNSYIEISNKKRSESEQFIASKFETCEENLIRAKRELIKPVYGIIYAKIASIHHPIDGDRTCNAVVGEIAETKAHNKFISLGFESKLMPLRHPFDILVNEYRVDVKTSLKKFIGSPKYSAKFWHFGIRKDKKDECDFFCCMADNKFWIIPSPDLKNVSSIYIPTGDSTRSWSKSERWNKYLGAFDLLDKGLSEKASFLYPERITA